MLDIETGGKPNWDKRSLILSIGLVKFTYKGIGETLYLKPDLVSQIREGFLPTRDTIAWWNTQPEEVFNESWLSPRDTIDHCITSITDFVDKYDKIWVKGAEFDYPIISAFFQVFGHEVPWYYTNLYCMRCIREFFSSDELSIDTSKIKHTALEDAIDQANYVIKAKQLSGLWPKLDENPINP